MINETPAQRLEVFAATTQIQYTLITSGTEYEENEYHQVVMGLLKTFPRDLLQLKGPVDYFGFCFKHVIKKGVNLYMLPNFTFIGPAEEDYASFMDYSNGFNRDLVKVFLIDGNIDNHQQVADMIKQIRFGYYIVIGGNYKINLQHYDPLKFFWNPHELIQLIKKDLPAIDEILASQYKFTIDKFNFITHPAADEQNNYYPTHLSHSNYYILNQILANYWLKKPKEFTNEDIPFFKQDRVSIQLKQCQIIDRITNALWINATVSRIEPLLAPMIIIAPFHFPRYGKLFPTLKKDKKQRIWLRASQSEQVMDYTFAIEADIAKSLTQKQFHTIFEAVLRRLIRLDSFAYLHAQLSYSPVFRLPLIGKSLNMDLSHFQKSFSDKKTAIKKISDLGKLMQEKLVAEDLKENLKARNGQIVFISDLPMEWLKLGEYPICLTHDVCRFRNLTSTAF